MVMLFSPFGLPFRTQIFILLLIRFFFKHLQHLCGKGMEFICFYKSNATLLISENHQGVPRINPEYLSCILGE